MVQCLEKDSKFQYVGMGFGANKELRYNMLLISSLEKPIDTIQDRLIIPLHLVSK